MTDEGHQVMAKAHIAFGKIRYQSWPPQAILVSDWPILKKYSPLKPLGQNLVGSIYGMSSMNIAHLFPIG
jgi:hypothetical protein